MRHVVSVIGKGWQRLGEIKESLSLGDSEVKA